MSLVSWNCFCSCVSMCMCACACVCMCPLPRPLIMSGVIWCDIDRVCMVGHTIFLDSLPREAALPYSFESIDACTGFLMYVCMTHLPSFISFHGLAHVFQHSWFKISYVGAIKKYFVFFLNQARATFGRTCLVSWNCFGLCIGICVCVRPQGH